MTKKEIEEFAICFSTILNECKDVNGLQVHAPEIANLSIQMIVHLIQKFNPIKEEMELMGDGEILKELNIL